MTDLTARLDAIKGATVTYAPQPYHKLNRQQLLTLCIALEDQRDRALDLARKQQAAIDAVTTHVDDATSAGYRVDGDYIKWAIRKALEAKP